MMYIHESVKKLFGQDNGREDVAAGKPAASPVPSWVPKIFLEKYFQISAIIAVFAILVYLASAYFLGVNGLWSDEKFLMIAFCGLLILLINWYQGKSNLNTPLAIMKFFVWSFVIMLIIGVFIDKRDLNVKTAGQATRALINSKFAPDRAKIWRTVYGPVEFIGKGMGDNDYVTTLQFGKNYLRGDVAVVEGASFQIYENGDWQEHFNRAEILHRSNQSGGFLGVKAVAGKKIRVSVRRLE